MNNINNVCGAGLRKVREYMSVALAFCLCIGLTFYAASCGGGSSEEKDLSSDMATLLQNIQGTWDIIYSEGYVTENDVKVADSSWSEDVSADKDQMVISYDGTVATVKYMEYSPKTGKYTVDATTKLYVEDGKLKSNGDFIDVSIDELKSARLVMSYSVENYHEVDHYTETMVKATK